MLSLGGSALALVEEFPRQLHTLDAVGAEFGIRGWYDCDTHALRRVADLNWLDGLAIPHEAKQGEEESVFPTEGFAVEDFGVAVKLVMEACRSVSADLTWVEVKARVTVMTHARRERREERMK